MKVKYKRFEYDENRRRFKTDETFDFYRDFLHRNGITYEMLAEILGVSVDTARGRAFRGTCKLRDIVNLSYFCNRKGIVVKEIYGSIEIMPSDEDKSRIDALWNRLKWIEEEV